MKILLTGASCFTGMWFARELSERGHEVVACFQKELSGYTGIRKERIEILLPHVNPIFKVSFGEDPFLQAIERQGAIDLFCHHGAFVTDYKSPAFDFASALSKNTYRIQAVLQALKESSCGEILLTGSVFEQREGGDQAVSPYGLSKGLTSDVFAYFATKLGIKLKKFVIPNPFGPFEEERFTTFLVKSWFSGSVPEISSPEYIRDNIPVGLLSKAYAFFAEEKHDGSFHPSFYAESQGDFTKRFSEALFPRLSIPCPYTLKKQVYFDEPKERVNTKRLNPSLLGFNESAFWDELATFYRERYG